MSEKKLTRYICTDDGKDYGLHSAIMEPDPNGDYYLASDADALLAERDAEILRLRTTGHGAAHELDNIAVECGLGHSPKPGDVAAHVRKLRDQLTAHREAVRVLVEDICGRDRSLHGLTGADDYKGLTVKDVPGATTNPAVAAIIDTALRSAGEEGKA